MSEHPVHPWYGPCDALLPDGGCSVCAGSPNPHIGSTLDVAHMAETGEVRTYDCRTTHHEGCACHEARHRSEVERLTRERDAARAQYDRLRDGREDARRERDAARAAYASASREWAERHEHARERILGLTGERDAARRELHRLTHGEDIEGDGVCRHEIDAQAARAERDEARAERAQLACEVSDLLIAVGRLTASLADERARATEMHRRAQAAEGQLGRVERLRESHAVEVGRLISRRRWDVSLWRGRYQQARRWSRLWHREARRLWREVQDLGAMLDDVQREVEPEQWIRELGGKP